eukprot:5905269-Pleurochrysis_carterae.AAC.1
MRARSCAWHVARPIVTGFKSWLRTKPAEMKPRSERERANGGADRSDDARLGARMARVQLHPRIRGNDCGTASEGKRRRVPCRGP